MSIKIVDIILSALIVTCSVLLYGDAKDIADAVTFVVVISCAVNGLLLKRSQRHAFRKYFELLFPGCLILGLIINEFADVLTVVYSTPTAKAIVILLGTIILLH